MSRDLSRLRLGTAPDSWGVWFAAGRPPGGLEAVPRRRRRTPATCGPNSDRRASCRRIRPQLRDELDQRGLKVCGGTVFAGLHKGKEALDKAIADFSREAKLLTEVGAKYLIHLPEQYTDMHTGEATESGDIDPEQWKNLITGTNELGPGPLRGVRRRAGVPPARRHPRRHPGPDRAVPARHRPRSSSTCAWTPGTSPTATATTCRSSSAFPERITYVHLKLVDPEVRERVAPEKLSLAEAVPLGIMVEPPYGEPEVPSAAGRAGRRSTGTSSPSSSRTCTRSRRTSRWPSRPARPGYFTALGLGPVRRWPY